MRLRVIREPVANQGIMGALQVKCGHDLSDEI